MTHILPGYIYSWMAENKSILAVPINGGFFSRCGDDHLIIPEESKSLVGYKCFLFVFRSFNTFFVFLPWKPTEKQRAINHSLVFSPCISATSQGNGLRPVARCRSPGKNNRSETSGSDLKPSNSLGPGSSPGASAPKSFGGVFSDSFPLEDSQKMPDIFYGIHPKIRSCVLPHSFCDCGLEVARNERTSKNPLVNHT